MNIKAIIKKLHIQKKALIARNPELKYHFVDIYYSKLKTSIPFLPIRCFRDFYIYNQSSAQKRLYKLKNPQYKIGADSKDNEIFENEITSFLSSGSTNFIRAKHSFSHDALNVFAFNSCKGFKNFLDRHHLKKAIVISLIPPPAVWPNSSLSAMVKMFENNGFCIKWCDIENLPKEKYSSDAKFADSKNDSNKIALYFLSMLKSLPRDSEVVVFGTTFHHLFLIQQFSDKKQISEKKKIFKQYNISIIDTGGTKGKTQAFNLNETKDIFKEFYSNLNNKKAITVQSKKNFKFFSEYGMCELASQAWSFNDDHDGTFLGNETLIPFAIDLQKYKVLTNNKPGFLGFIDTANIESYSAIITEDLGFVISSKKRTFKLLGRAPDASIKGCSLNLKNFKFTKNAPNTNAIFSSHTKLSRKSSLLLNTKGSHSEFTTQLTAESIGKNLNKKYWNAYSICDFKKSFSSLKDISFFAKNTQAERNITYSDLQHSIVNDFTTSHFSKKNILLISAANTPISFFYPLIYCAISGANSFTLKIPSLRANDPLSESIRLQILDLFQNSCVYFPNTQFFIHESKSLEDVFVKYDCVFVFGTDETLQIVQKHCTPKIKFLGFGDIKNAFVVNIHKHTPKFLAQLCSVWDARGCLTPICLFIDVKDRFYEHNFVITFFKSFTNAMNKRLKSLKKISFHDHNALHIKAQLKKIGYENCIYPLSKKISFKEPTHKSKPTLFRSRWVTVVDLSMLCAKEIEQMSLDFSLGGSGFVFILPLTMQNEFPMLSFKPIFPTFRDFLKELTQIMRNAIK